ncbi:transcriptional antiterminator, BglG family [Lachnospiraceae bacterium C7]|nr:transcriptional antiterminator, BglG family [Lachnospiraceae bacterium C7]
MFRIKKVLNHNAVIAIVKKDDGLEECLVLGKGIGFGKKVSEQFEIREDDRIYSLEEASERGKASEMVKEIPPIYLEIAGEVLKNAETKFGCVDTNIVFPMADHIEYAVKRIKNNEQISNPLTDDIKVLFYVEYKIAEVARKLLKERLGIEIDDDEVGYIALHVHSAIQSENVAQSMQIAKAVRECISLIEKETKTKIKAQSLSYNRMMNHIRYMVTRALTGEPVKLNMNDYIANTYPDSFAISTVICDQLGKSLGKKLDDVEIGYLAMHIERVKCDIQQEKKGV